MINYHTQSHMLTFIHLVHKITKNTWSQLIIVNYRYIFTLLYLVFLSYFSLFYTLLPVFLSFRWYLSEIIKERTKKIPKELRESWDSCHDMVLACHDMLLHQTNSREQYAATWSFCSAAFYVSLIVDFCSMLQHVKTMTRHGGLDL